MADKHYMNPSVAKHMSEGEHGDHEPSSDVKQETGQHKAPHISIHSHEKGHTVHIMHHDGSHTKHEHAHGDADGISAHIHKHLGGKQGQDHGYSSGEAEEDEMGAGPGV